MGTWGAPSVGGPKERGVASARSIASKYKLSCGRFLGLLEPRPFASSWGIPPVDWLASSPAPMTWVQHCTMQFALR
eukprot:scaffold1955_cov35-Tisochrysis_lutea.AAC.1